VLSVVLYCQASSHNMKTREGAYRHSVFDGGAAVESWFVHLVKTVFTCGNA
jgi:hypothetical protein